MTQFKITKNKNLPDEVINRNKDFGKLMNNHQQMMKYKDATRPLYKNPGFMSFIVVVCVVVLTLVLTDNDKEEKSSIKDTTAIRQDILKDTASIETPVTKPAMDSVSSSVSTTVPVTAVKNEVKNPEIAFSSFKIDAKQGASIYIKSTRILIPAFAFKDAMGGTITGEVEVRYREFRDPVDMYLAGIPMHVQEGKAGYLESAGMFEIKGFSANKEVYLQKPLTVELASAEHGNGYNTYYFNDKKKAWEIKGKESRYIRFMVQADEKEYPELRPFKDVIWEFAVNEQQKDPGQYRTIFSKVWSSFAVSEAAVLNTKDVKIKQNSSESKFLAHPVSLINNEEANQRLMKAKFDEYYSLLRTKEKVVRDLEDAKRKQEEWSNSPQGKNYLEWAKSEQGQKQIMSSRVVNVFQVDNFGLWNCDRQIQKSNSAKLTASFTDQHGKKLDLREVYLVDYSINSLFLLNKGVVSFNPNSKNTLWAALPEGKLAVFNAEKFKTIKSTSGDFTFAMDVIDINGKEVNDLRKTLQIEEHVAVKAAEKDKDPIATYERVIQIKKPLRESETFYKSDVSEIDEGFRMKADAEKTEAEAKVKAEQERLRKEAEEKAKTEAEKAKQDALHKGQDLLKKKW